MRANYWELLLFIIAGVLLGYLLTLGSYLVLAVRARNVRPSCGKCGYNVQNASSFRCVECGSDLRLVGISVAKSTMKPALIAIALGFLVTAAVIIAGMVLAL